MPGDFQNQYFNFHIVEFNLVKMHITQVSFNKVSKKFITFPFISVLLRLHQMEEMQHQFQLPVTKNMKGQDEKFIF